MKRADYPKILLAAIISLVSLAVLTVNALNINNILGSGLMALAVAVIAWIGKRRPIAVGIGIGALLFVAIFGWIDQMGWLARP